MKWTCFCCDLYQLFVGYNCTCVTSPATRQVQKLWPNVGNSQRAGTGLHRGVASGIQDDQMTSSLTPHDVSSSHLKRSQRGKGGSRYRTKLWNGRCVSSPFRVGLSASVSACFPCTSSVWSSFAERLFSFYLTHRANYLFARCAGVPVLCSRVRTTAALIESKSQAGPRGREWKATTLMSDW